MKGKHRTLWWASALALVGVLALAWFGANRRTTSSSTASTVDSEGAAAPVGFELLEPSSFDASESSDEWSDSARAEADVAPPPSELADERRPTRLLGRVLDGNGAPVVGATVYAAEKSRGPAVPLDAEVWGERSRRRRQATTDDSGRFVIDDARAGPTRIAVRSPTSAPFDADHFVAVAELDNQVGDLVVGLGVRLSGRVIDARGAPVEGALILQPFNDSDPSWRLRASATGVTLGVAASNGSFDVGPLAVGPWTLLVHDDRHGEMVRRGLTSIGGERIDGIEVRFEATSSVTGQVRLSKGAGRPPLDRFSITASYAGDRARLPGEADFTRRYARCDPSGAFEVQGLFVDEPYRLRVRWHRNSDDWRGNELGREVDALAGDRNVALDVAPFSVVTYRPIDASTGASIDEVDGRLLVPREESRERTLASTTSSAGGGVWRETTAEVPASREYALLEVRHSAFRPARSGPLHVEAGVELDAGDVRLEPLGRLDVRVVSSLDGKPIRGARVVVELLRGDDGTRPVDQVTQPLAGERAPRVRSRETDADGLASVFASLGAAGRACVTHDDWPSPELREVSFADGPSERVEFALTPGATVEALVVDDFGPVAGALVRARRTTPPSGTSDDLRNQSRSLRTDSNGIALFEQLTPGPARIELVGERLGAPRTPDERAGTSVQLELVAGFTERIELRATPTGELSGRVLEGRSAVAGARIELRAGRSRDLDRGRGDSGPEITAISDAAGRYSIPRLGAGIWNLRVTHPTRLVAYVIDLEFEGRRLERDIELPASIVAGRVLDREGRAIEGARISLGRLTPDPRNRNERNWSTLGMNGVVRSDASGGFELRGVPVDVELQLSAEHPRYQSARSERFKLRTDEFKSGVDIALRLGGIIDVELTTSDGHVPRVRVSARRIADEKGKPVQRQGERTVALNGRGRARFTGLVAGRYRVVVERRFGIDDQQPTREVNVSSGKTSEVRFDVP